MLNVSTLVAEELARHVKAREGKGLLRFVVCGGPDDGKSTLVARLLHESDAAPDKRQSIDVVYGSFSTGRRKFMVADAPGGEQSTRNMVSGASTADAAIVLVDAARGIVEQTRRHTYLVSLLGIRHVALAVNKMDRADYAETRCREIEAAYRRFAEQIGLREVTCIPVSALAGDNILVPGAHTPWYRGPTLMGWLETVEVDERRLETLPLRVPVQWTQRPDAGPRACSGTVASGSVRKGERVRLQPSGRETAVSRILVGESERERAVAGEAVTLLLADPVEIARGELISTADAPAQVADQFEASVVWMGAEPLLRGRAYLMKIGAKSVAATISPVKYKLNVGTLEHLAAERLERNEIGVCELELEQPVCFDPYAENRATGGFILVDPITNETVGAGMLRFALRRAHNIHRQHIDVDSAARAALKRQKPCVLWLTGLSASGKSTIANLVEKKLHAMGRHTYILDGDNVRHGLNKDLGFTAEDRVENIRRIAEVAKLMVDAGLIVLTAFISPFRAERRMARALFRPGEFIEIYVDARLELAESRDPKGLYRKARRGEIKNFTGIDSPYEAPEAPELRLDTGALAPAESADRVLEFLRQGERLGP